MSKNVFLFTTVQKYKNRLIFSKVMIPNVLPPSLWFTVYNVHHFCTFHFQETYITKQNKNITIYKILNNHLSVVYAYII